MAKSKEVKQIGNILKGISAWDNPSVGRVYDQNYCAPTINTCSGGGKQPYIIVKGRKDNVKRSNDKASDQSGRDLLESRGGADLSFPTSKTRRGRVQGDGDLSPTILAGANEICFLGVNDVDEDKEEIRRITPREAWRLMDFSDEDYDKAAAINSQTALYAQAGNAIVRQVLIDIFGQMINPKPIENEQLSIF